MGYGPSIRLQGSTVTDRRTLTAQSQPDRSHRSDSDGDDTRSHEPDGHDPGGDQAESYDAHRDESERNGGYGDDAHSHNPDGHYPDRGVADGDRPAGACGVITTTLPMAKGHMDQRHASPVFRRSILKPRHLGSSAM